MIYPYISHYFYDLLVVSLALLVGKQLFHLKFSFKQFLMFLAVMMLCYQFNFYIVERFFGKEYKYVILYIGMLIGYSKLLKLNLIASLIVIMTTAVVNGIWTNVNIMWMLTFLFDTYEEALASQHVQYTCYTLTTCVFNGLLILFRVHIFDIQKYT